MLRPKLKSPPLSVARLPQRDAMGALDRATRQGRAFEGMPDTATIERDLDAERLAASQRAGNIGIDAAPPGVGAAPQVVHEPGGDALRQLLPQSFTVFEREFRILPDEGMFSPTLSPNQPYDFVVGNFRVPRGMELWLSDYQFGLYSFDGIAAADFRMAEETRFSGSMTFDLSVNSTHRGDLQYQLDPVANEQSAFSSAAVPGRTGGTSSFNAAASISASNSSAAGSAALPMRRSVQGPQGRSPWTWCVLQGQNVQMRCTVFRPIKQPFAAVFGRIAGHKLDGQLAQAIRSRLRPR